MIYNLKHRLLVALIFPYLFSYPSLAQIPFNLFFIEYLSATSVPDTPPPQDQNTPSSGTLDPNTSKCPQPEIMALVPPNPNDRLATSAYPTIWFYIPYETKDVREGRFSILTRNGKRRIYRTSFTLPKAPGIFSVSLPNSSEYALEEGMYYKWFIEIYCTPNTTLKPDKEIYGWVQKISAESSIESQNNTEIWYDAIAQLGNKLIESPNDEAIKRRWVEFLEVSGYSHLAQVEVIGSVQLTSTKASFLPKHKLPNNEVDYRYHFEQELVEPSVKP